VYSQHTSSHFLARYPRATPTRILGIVKGGEQGELPSHFKKILDQKLSKKIMKNKISLSEKQEQENRESKLVISFFFFF
jgi:hypothetical protein